MPRLSKAMKDVISCDKLRLEANTHLPVDFRMGQPNSLKNYYPKGCKPGELKHLSTRRKRKQLSDSLSSGERKGNSPNHKCYGICGVVGLQY